MTKPTLGQVVIFTSRGSSDGKFKPEDRAAIITQIREIDIDPEFASPYVEDNYDVSITVFHPGGIFFDSAPFSPEARPGHWSWPVRV